MNVENWGWLFGIVALGMWAISVWRQRNRYATVDQERMLEQRVLMLEAEVNTLKGMYYESQMEIRRNRKDIEFFKRRAEEAEAASIALRLALDKLKIDMK